jgi:hypothetical protein
MVHVNHQLQEEFNALQRYYQAAREAIGGYMEANIGLRAQVLAEQNKIMLVQVDLAAEQAKVLKLEAEARVMLDRINSLEELATEPMGDNPVTMD